MGSASPRVVGGGGGGLQGECLIKGVLYQGTTEGLY